MTEEDLERVTAAMLDEADVSGDLHPLVIMHDLMPNPYWRGRFVRLVREKLTHPSFPLFTASWPEHIGPPAKDKP
jgi:hypothetical protein